MTGILYSHVKFTTLLVLDFQDFSDLTSLTQVQCHRNQIAASLFAPISSANS